MELDVWTSSTITSLTQDQRTNKWHASISQHEGVKRDFVFNHVIFCTGLSGVTPNIPVYPGLVCQYLFFFFFSVPDNILGKVQRPSAPFQRA